jgi:hypothetical protein
MKTVARRLLLTLIIGSYLIVLLLLARVDGVAQVFGEYLRPTSVEGDYIPKGRSETHASAPSDLLHIVAEQSSIYRLTLQRVTVCESSVHLAAFETRTPGLRGLFGEESSCRPLYRGCCSCQFGRHVIVMAASPSGKRFHTGTCQPDSEPRRVLASQDQYGAKCLAEGGGHRASHRVVGVSCGGKGFAVASFWFS